MLFVHVSVSQYSRVEEERISVELPQSEVRGEVQLHLQVVTTPAGQTLSISQLITNQNFQ